MLNWDTPARGGGALIRQYNLYNNNCVADVVLRASSLSLSFFCLAYVRVHVPFNCSICVCVSLYLSLYIFPYFGRAFAKIYFSLALCIIICIIITLLAYFGSHYVSWHVFGFMRSFVP